MDFHPNMLATQRVNLKASASTPDAGFHPGMLARQQLAGLGAVGPAPAAPAPFGFDAQTGELIIGANRVKLVSALLSAIAVKLVFFSGNQVVKGAKHLHKRFKGEPAAATNPKRSERPWQGVRFNPGWKKLATKRHKTKGAASRWSTEHGGPGRHSYVG